MLSSLFLSLSCWFSAFWARQPKRPGQQTLSPAGHMMRTPECHHYTSPLSGDITDVLGCPSPELHTTFYRRWDLCSSRGVAYPSRQERRDLTYIPTWHDISRLVPKAHSASVRCPWVPQSACRHSNRDSLPTKLECEAVVSEDNEMQILWTSLEIYIPHWTVS